MGPPNKILMPPSQADDMAEIRRRLDRLERSSQLNNATITDPAGVTRVRFGLLPDGSYGFALYDASGNVLATSSQLVQVMQHLGFAQAGAGSTTSLVPVLMSGSDFTFTLTQTTRIYVIIWCNGTAPAGQTATVEPWMDGTPAANGYLRFGATLPDTTLCWAFATVLSAGSHTADLHVSVAAPATFTWARAIVDVYALGGV